MTESERTTARHLSVVPGSRSHGAPLVDERKVAVLREAIANGTYRVDPAAIARRMLESGALDHGALLRCGASNG